MTWIFFSDCNLFRTNLLEESLKSVNNKIIQLKKRAMGLILKVITYVLVAAFFFHPFIIMKERTFLTFKFHSLCLFRRDGYRFFLPVLIFDSQHCKKIGEQRNHARESDKKKE